MTYRKQGVQHATIAAGASLSNAVEVGGRALVGLILASTWDTAIITFQASADGYGGTYYNIYLDDANTELQVPNTAAVASRAIAMNTVLDKLAAFDWIKIRSGTAASPTNQADATVIKLVLKS